MKMIKWFFLNWVNMNGGENAISHGLQLASGNSPHPASPRLAFMKTTLVRTQAAFDGSD